MENARIEYLPHCSKCGALITERPQYSTFIRDEVLNNQEWCKVSAEIRIEPERCENCGAFFECIEIKPPVRI